MTYRYGLTLKGEKGRVIEMAQSNSLPVICPLESVVTQIFDSLAAAAAAIKVKAITINCMFLIYEREPSAFDTSFAALCSTIKTSLCF